MNICSIERGGVAMNDHRYIIDNITALLKECEDTELLYLIQSLLIINSD